MAAEHIICPNYGASQGQQNKYGPADFRKPVSVLGFDLGSVSASATTVTTLEPEPSFTTSFSDMVLRPSHTAPDINYLLSEMTLTTGGGPPLPPPSPPPKFRSGPPPVLVHHHSMQNIAHGSISPASSSSLLGSSIEPRTQRHLRSCQSLPVSPYHGYDVGPANPPNHRPQTSHVNHRSLPRESYSGEGRALQRSSMDSSTGAFSPPPSPSLGQRFRGASGPPRGGGVSNRAGRGSDSPRHRNYRKLWNSVVQVKRGGRLGDSEVSSSRVCSSELS